MRLKEICLLLLLTAGALAVHGYHPYSEDAEIYLPGVEKILHPQLFPFNAEFFQSHARLTFFPNLIAFSVRATHLPFDVVLLLWQMASVFLLLLACWQLSGKCFTDRKARWAGVALVAGLLTLPVAGTALYILDQYINPRNLAAFAAVFAVARTVERKFVQAGLWLVFAALIHPLMAVFAFSFCVLLCCWERFTLASASVTCLLPLGLSFQPVSKAYHEAALQHSYFFLLHWEWYEWLGILGPVAVLWWFSRLAAAKQLPVLKRLCQALVVYDLIYFASALVIMIPPRFEALTRLQPLRSLHLLYILLVLFSGGFLGEYVLKDRVWRWLALFVPVCVGMFVAQRQLFPASAHIEWPGSAPKNAWAQAFVWIRQNTPNDAIFALDPLHMRIDGEDTVGFRALAQRSMLVDACKDSGAVSMFPQLADEWLQQVQAQQGWATFGLQDFRSLQAKYGANWFVLQTPGVAGLDCPYQNRAVAVCRLP